MNKRFLFWLVNVVINSGPFIGVLAMLERMTGYCLDWPNGCEAMPRLAERL